MDKRSIFTAYATGLLVVVVLGTVEPKRMKPLGWPHWVRSGIQQLPAPP
jgi:hypothetical protein